MEVAGDITHDKKQYVALPNEKALSPSRHVPSLPGSDASDATDYVDDTDGGSDSAPSTSSSSVHQMVQPVVDTSSSQVSQRVHESQQQEPSDASIINDRSDSTVISVINHHQRNQCNQLQPPTSQEEVSGAYTSMENSMTLTRFRRVRERGNVYQLLLKGVRTNRSERLHSSLAIVKMPPDFL